ncbi:MAG: 1-acyl-sn-glycerol-3-phosphate acyltransferase [Desulfobulbaceae bacterium]|jgi:1-acyl-sn-glycerol-3-phosphate acyltransferase|nr:1-acyl-sn-glycerol-3-phosphate acyltransferase [Desulfobulbaceae bacterium]
MNFHHSFILFLVKTLVFGKISRLGAPLPEKGAPVLYLGFHRNGAVDGWVYAIALARPVEFMVAAKLMKNPLAKFFFWGLEVTRRSDGNAPVSNRQALGEATSLLVQGNSLFIFPEGTSTLGPKHLEFMKGAALIAARACKERPDLRVVPLSIRYGSPPLWGGDVEVIVGRALSSTDFTDPFEAQNLHETFAEALESLDPDFASEDEMEDAGQVASLAFSFMPYSAALRLAVKLLPTEAAKLWRSYQQESATCKKWRGVAIFPDDGAGREALKFLFSGAAVLAATLVNFLPVAAGTWAGRRLPDGPNVVLLWKSLAYLTVFLIYTPLLWGVFFALLPGKLAAFLCAAHLGVTVLGCKWIEPCRKSSVSLWNFLFHRDLRAKYQGVKEAIRNELMA